jgi:putative proteasome-type protease
VTYCVGLCLDRGIVFMSDTRTNAGLDNISTFRKLHSWQLPGERAMVLLTAGNLATTQAVISLLEERTKAHDERDPTILSVPSMFQAARLVAGTLRDVIETHASTGQRADSTFNATMILGGQIKGGPPRLFLIYPEGNFIEASGETPFFQIGETKYGRPILVRAYESSMSFADAYTRRTACDCPRCIASSWTILISTRFRMVGGTPSNARSRACQTPRFEGGRGQARPNPPAVGVITVTASPASSTV